MKRSRSLDFRVFFRAFLMGLLLGGLLGGGAAPVWAAPCCARSAGMPSLLLGEDRAQLSLSSGFSSVIEEAKNSGGGVPVLVGTFDRTASLRLDGALLVSDRAQVSASVGVGYHGVQMAGTQDGYFGLGDTRLGVGYEVLPVWNYSSWKPQGFAFLGLSLPTGRSVNEQLSPLGADILGSGFYSLAAGLFFQKRFASWDTFFTTEAHKPFAREFSFDGILVRVEPKWGGSASVGVGYSLGERLRFGLRVQPKWDQTETGAWIFSNDCGADAAVLLGEWPGGDGTSATLGLSYTDQTLLGPVRNADLSRTVAVFFQQRWER